MNHRVQESLLNQSAFPKDAVAQKKDFCLRAEKTDRFLQLKQTHLFFYQIQATMSYSGCQWCDFVQRTSVDLHIERVPFDKEFLKVTVLRLRAFFFSAILPELAVP